MIIGQGKNIRFGGVGAAHQNRVAGRSIKTVTYMVHTMMIHVSMSIPEGLITTYIYPVAMDNSCWIYNSTPKQITGLSPYVICNRPSYTPHKDLFRNCHVLGAPTYLLDPKLHKSGVKIPKYQLITRKSVFIG